MTWERNRFTETENAEALRRCENDDRLSLWAISAVGAALLQHGLIVSEVETIVRDALCDYANFRRLLPTRECFVARRRAKAKLHVASRIETASDLNSASRTCSTIRTKEALEFLSEKERTALRILFHEKKSYEDVAIELDVSVAYARRLVTRAITKLRNWRPPREPWD
jgi:hypothetical protein